MEKLTASPIEITPEHRLQSVFIGLDNDGKWFSRVTFTVVDEATGNNLDTLVDEYTGEDFNTWYANYNTTTALYIAHAVKHGLTIPGGHDFDGLIVNQAGQDA